MLVNPKSGKGKSREAAEYLKTLLKQQGIKAFFHLCTLVTETKLLTRQLAKQYSKIIVISGDGTLNSVINGIAGSNCKLAIIPTGTANVLATELGIPRSFQQAATIALQDNTQPIDLGKVNNHYFSLMCGIGFDAQVISNLKPALKQMFHKIAYPLAGAKTLMNYKPERLVVIINDNVVKEGYFALAANARYYGGKFSVAKHADLSDSHLDVCVFKKSSSIDFLKYIAAILTGTQSPKDMEYFKAKKVKVVAEDKVLIQADGDVIGKTPAEISVRPSILEVVVP